MNCFNMRNYRTVHPLRLVSLGLGFLFLLSCSGPAPLEYALKSAGDNRPELERVLAHYESDSLKYKAARFLIENMVYHSHYSGEELEIRKQFYKYLAEVNRPAGVIRDSLAYEVRRKNLDGVVLKKDIEVVGFDYLVDNIEWAFKVREEQPWGKNIPFEAFCEYVLPYRLGDEDLSYWREEIYHLYNPLLDSIRNLPQAEDPLFAAQTLIDSLRKTPIHFVTSTTYPYRVGPELAKWQSGTCLEITDAATYIFRALGLSCSADMMLLRGDGNVAHYWNYTSDSEGKPYYFSLAYAPEEFLPAKEYPQVLGKVYRETFSHNAHLAIPEKERTDVHPQFRSPKLIDVTAQYAPTELSLRFPIDSLSRLLGNGEVAYLCQASFRNWQPVAVAQYQNKQLLFTDVVSNVAYVIAIYQDGVTRVISDPFYVDEDAVLHHYTPTEEKSEIVL